MIMFILLVRAMRSLASVPQDAAVGECSTGENPRALVDDRPQSSHRSSNPSGRQAALARFSIGE